MFCRLAGQRELSGRRKEGDMCSNPVPSGAAYAQERSLLSL